MEVAQLLSVAEQLGVKVSQNDDLEKVIYDILDKAAIESAATEASSTKRKRTRIAKKDTDHVYSVKGKEGENYDTKAPKGKSVEAPTLFPELPEEEKKKGKKTKAEADASDPLAAFPKHRGRKSKAELAAIAAAEAAKKEQEVEEPAQPVDVEEAVPEAAIQPIEPEEAPDPEMFEKLQVARVSQLAIFSGAS